MPGLLFSSLFAQPAVRSFSSYYFFGDSLTDNGNLFFYTGQPPAPYFNGRFSNGPTYAEYLKPGVAAVSTTASTVKTNLVFAFAGATAVGSTPIPASLSVQLGIFQSRAITPTANDLFVVLAGANDILNTISNPATQNPNAVAAAANAASAAVATTARSLATAGAKNILVINLPNIAQTPRFTTGSGVPAASLAETGSLAFNSSIRANILASNMPADVNVTIVDLRSVLVAMIRTPAAFGFTITNQDVIDILGAGGNPGNIDNYIFWDSIHPTTRASAIVANIITEILNPEFVLGTAGAQGTAVLALADMTADTVDTRLDMIRHGAMRHDADGFVSYNYKDGSRDGNSYQPEFGYKANVITAGFDVRFGHNVFAGLALSADNMKGTIGTIGSGAGSFRIKGETGTAYLQYQSGAYFAEATANYSTHDVRDIRRTTVLGGFQTSATTKGSSYGGSLRLGGDFGSDSLHVSPFLGIRYSKGKLNQYEESGVASLNFAYGGQEVESITGSIGISTDWTIHTGETPMALNLLAVYQNEMGNDVRALTGRLADNISQPTRAFIEDGNGDSLKAGARLSGAISKRWGWSAGFLAEFRDNGDTAKQYSVSLQTGF